jgi:hypothetical protein
MAALVAAQEKGLLLRAWEIHQPPLHHREITVLLAPETSEEAVEAPMQQHLDSLGGPESSHLSPGHKVHTQ